MRAVLRLVALSCIALAATPAFAATVTVSTGTVSVNSGSGWSQVVLASPANPGDKVMAAKDSAGEIVYDDGCFERVKPGQVKTVKATSPCKGVAPGGLAGLDLGVIAGVAAAGGIIAIVASGDNNDDAPASP